MSRSVILVVEDEVLIRLDAVDVIEDAGYEVIDVGNADEAIVFLETRDDIKVVFTDIDMPGSMDGLKLAHAIRLRWPPVILIIASGRVIPRASDMPHGTVFIPKPYRHDRVLAEIAQALQALS